MECAFRALTIVAGTDFDHKVVVFCSFGVVVKIERAGGGLSDGLLVFISKLTKDRRLVFLRIGRDLGHLRGGALNLVVRPRCSLTCLALD